MAVKYIVLRSYTDLAQAMDRALLKITGKLFLDDIQIDVSLSK